MKIKMLTSVRGDPSADPGDEIDVPNHVAVKWIKSGSAVEVKVTKKTNKRKTTKATRSTANVERAVLHED